MHAVVRSKLTHHAAIIAAAVLTSGLVFWMLRTYEVAATSWYPKCVFYQATGLHCPGCGGTRAVRALAHGELVLAVRSNPMLILGVPAMLLLVFIQRRRERAGGLASPRLAWTLFIVLMVYFVARNVPSPTRSWLAPPPGTADAPN